MHHNTLKSAISKYKPVFEQGTLGEELKSLISADEKEFSAEDVDTIYSAIVAPEEGKEVYVVSKPFRAVNNFLMEYQEGEDVSHFEKATIEHLVNIGYVEKQ